MSNLAWVKVAELDTLTDGQIMTVTAAGCELCLVRVGDRWSALDNACPHQCGPMGEGTLVCAGDGTCVVQCPWHGWSFDAQTGKAPDGSGEPGLATYPVEARDDGVYVGLEDCPTTI